VIFRGEGGRELLADTLRQRGARVEYAECYRRIKPQADTTPLQQQHFDAVIVTSSEGLQNLRELLSADWPAFRSVAYFVPHERIAQMANQLGVQQALITHGGDAGCIEVLSQHFRMPAKRG